MADYQLTATETVLRSIDGAAIPNDPANRDRAEYDAWLAAGGVPEPYVPPPEPVPDISKAQALLYLLSIGRSEADVDAAIATIADPKQREVARIEWGYRQPFHASHPLFAALAPALGIVDIATAFRAAARL